MKRSTLVRTVAVGATCALVGGAAGIAGSSASSTPHTTKGRVKHDSAETEGKLPPGGPRVAFAIGGVAGPAVHSESVVPNEKGGFDTVTMDRGTFSSLSGEQLTINEGTKTATYKTVTLTIPSDATVYRNGEKASLSDIKSGDTVTVVQGTPKGTVVNAFDAEHEPKPMLRKQGEGGPGPDTKKLEGPPPPGGPEGAEGFSLSQGGESSSSS